MKCGSKEHGDTAWPTISETGHVGQQSTIHDMTLNVGGIQERKSNVQEASDPEKSKARGDDRFHVWANPLPPPALLQVYSLGVARGWWRSQH